MQRLCFEDMDTFAKEIIDTWVENKNAYVDFLGISVVAKYDIAIDFLNSIMKGNGFRMSNIKIEHPDIRGYNREWIVTLSSDGEIWSQEAYFDDTGYIGSDPDEIIYVHGETNSKYVQKNCDSKLIEFDFCDDESDEHDNSYEENN